MKRALCWMAVVGMLVSSLGCCCWVPAGRGRGHRGPGGGYGGHEGRGAGGYEGGLERK